METGTKKSLGLEFKLASASSAENDSKSRYYDTPPQLNMLLLDKHSGDGNNTLGCM